jgi:hypothetical protein
MNDQHARDAARIAVRILRRSERGCQALHDFRALLDNGGAGLDDENWQAMVLLCQLAADGKGFAIEAQFKGSDAVGLDRQASA